MNILIIINIIKNDDLTHNNQTNVAEGGFRFNSSLYYKFGFSFFGENDRSRKCVHQNVRDKNKVNLLVADE